MTLLLLLDFANFGFAFTELLPNSKPRIISFSRIVLKIRKMWKGQVHL